MCSLRAVDSGLPPGQTGILSYLSLQDSSHLNENLQNTGFTNYIWQNDDKYSRAVHAYILKLSLTFLLSHFLSFSMSLPALCVHYLNSNTVKTHLIIKALKLRSPVHIVTFFLFFCVSQTVIYVRISPIECNNCSVFAQSSPQR